MGGQKWEKTIKTKARDFVFKNRFGYVQTHAQRKWWEKKESNVLFLAISNGGQKEMLG